MSNFLAKSIATTRQNQNDLPKETEAPTEEATIPFGTAAFDDVDAVDTADATDTTDPTDTTDETTDTTDADTVADPVVETPAMTETISDSNIDDIVETLYSIENPDEVIGYSCKSLLENNSVEPMNLMFYMDIKTPIGDNSTNTTSPQEEAVSVSQQVLLRELSREFQIDPQVSRGIRCFDPPVDGSTWMVQMTIETREFVEVTLFGGCRELEWTNTTHDCNFYEAHVRGFYLGNVATDSDGNRFGDAVAKLEDVINGPQISDILTMTNAEVAFGIGSTPIDSIVAGDWETAYLGVPMTTDNPNFQGGADQGKDVLNDPTNIKTGIHSQPARSNRKTITAVGGFLVACFSIAFAMVGYILWQRRRSYQKSKNNTSNDTSMMDFEGEHGTGAEAGLHYDDGMDDQNNNGGRNHSYDSEPYEKEEPFDDMEDIYQHQEQSQEYPNIPMSADAIQNDLGNALKGQMMGGYSQEQEYQRTQHQHPTRAQDNLFSPERAEGSELDDSDSWAQTEGTIGSLELQLEPITAEV